MDRRRFVQETAVITSAMQEFADLEVRNKIKDSLEIDEECKKIFL